MLKYTLEEIQIKVLEYIEYRHKELIKDSVANVYDTSLVVNANDMMVTFENMDTIFKELIQEENINK